MKNSFLSVTALTFSAVLAQDLPEIASNYDGKCLQCIYEGNTFCILLRFCASGGIRIHIQCNIGPIIRKQHELVQGPQKGLIGSPTKGILGGPR